MVLPKSRRLERVVVIDRVLQLTILAISLELTANHRMDRFVLSVFQIRRHAGRSPQTRQVGAYVSASQR